MIISLQHSWEQTPEHVIVTVSIKGINRAQMDTTLSESYIKINSRPHFFDADLLHSIDDANSRIAIDPSAFTATFTLKKLEPIEWEDLKYKPINKEDLTKRRQLSLDKLQKRNEEARLRMMQTKREEEKRLMEAQWEIERTAKSQVQQNRKAEQESAENELYEWQKTVEQRKLEDVKAIELGAPSIDRNLTIFKEEEMSKNNTIKEVEEIEGKLQDHPPVREQGGTVKLKFTPRLFKTPAREDKDTEVMKKYEIWKSRTTGKSNEENPTWIKEKGDSFLRRQNYEAAINAYTEAIRLDPAVLTCYSNRAACYLQIQDYARCISDCDHVIDIINKEQQRAGERLSEKGASVMVKMLARRGTAHFKCGNLKKAEEDYKMAVQLENGKDEKLIMEYEMIKNLINPSCEGGEKVVCQEQQFKQQGDDYYKNDEFTSAVNYYTKAINIDQYFFPAISNRAACYLRLNKFIECIEDCTFLIDNLYTRKDCEDREQLFNKGTLLLKARTRRAAAYFALEDYQRAYDDYEQASRITPEDEALMKEMEKTSEKLSSQTQAEWLRNRGNFFYKNEDYKSAIHLYSLAIKQNPSNPTYYSNRAQCYLKLENYVQCINNCNAALTVLTDEDQKKFDKITNKTLNQDGAHDVMAKIPTNILLTPTLQFKVYKKRAEAYKALEECEKAYMDLKRAHQLMPSQEFLLKEIEELQPKVDEIVKERQRIESENKLKD